MKQSFSPFCPLLPPANTHFCPHTLAREVPGVSRPSRARARGSLSPHAVWPGGLGSGPPFRVGRVLVCCLLQARCAGCWNGACSCWSCFRKALNTSVVGRGLFHVVTFEDSVLKILPPRAPVSEELCPVPRVTRIVGIFSAYEEGLSILSSFLPSPFSRMPLSTKWLEFWYLFLFCLRLHLFLERGRERERERNISVWLPLARPLLGTWQPQVCTLTGDQTSNPLVHRLVLNH